MNDGEVADFKPATRNANQHTARGLGAIDKSIRTDGYGDPMLAAADGEMISGSARLETVAQVFGADASRSLYTRTVRGLSSMCAMTSRTRGQAAIRLALAANRG